MERRTGKRRSARLIAVIAVIAAFAVFGCASICEAGEKETADKFEMIRVHIQTWVSEASKDGPIISSSRLKEKIVGDWGNQSKKYQIVSVRKPDDYKGAGHIPNAINIYWPDIVRDESLTRLDSHKTLILYCYYGHGSMMTSTVLSLLGYRCKSLDFGMMDWNLGALVKDPWDQKQAEYQIVDVRSERDYESGHVPSAINIPWVGIAKIENLKKIDPHRTVIVCSDNGQTGQLATTVLNLLDYHAVNMLFGMMDWNKAYVDSHNQWDGVASYPAEHEK